MARIVKLSDQTPLIIREKDLVNGLCAVCRCGLSGAWPMCDGTHKATAGEERDRLYRYERELPQGTVRREEVGEHQGFPQQRAEARRPRRPGEVGHGAAGDPEARAPGQEAGRGGEAQPVDDDDDELARAA